MNSGTHLDCRSLSMQTIPKSVQACHTLQTANNSLKYLVMKPKCITGTAMKQHWQWHMLSWGTHHCEPLVRECQSSQAGEFRWEKKPTQAFLVYNMMEPPQSCPYHRCVNLIVQYKTTPCDHLPCHCISWTMVILGHHVAYGAQPINRPHTGDTHMTMCPATLQTDLQLRKWSK